MTRFNNHRVIVKVTHLPTGETWCSVPEDMNSFRIDGIRETFAEDNKMELTVSKDEEEGATKIVTFPRTVLDECVLELNKR